MLKPTAASPTVSPAAARVGGRLVDSVDTWLHEWICYFQPALEGLKSVALVFYCPVLTTVTSVNVAPVSGLVLKAVELLLGM